MLSAVPEFTPLFHKIERNSLLMTVVLWFSQESNLQQVRLEQKAGSDLEEVEAKLVQLLDDVIADCR